MTDASDPSHHQQLERQFIGHLQRLLSDDRLRLPVAGGRKSTSLIRDVRLGDRGVQLKRLMSEMGKPDRELESRMPVGASMDVELSRKKWRVLRSTVGRFRAVCLSPTPALVAGQEPQPLSAADLAQTLSAAALPSGIPLTLAIMSTSGFTADARQAALKIKDRAVILVCPNETGGWTVAASPDATDIAELFDPELDLEKRARIRAEIDADRVGLLSSGIAADKIAAKLRLSPQLVESELRSYANQTPGLAAKRLDGRWVLFREGSAPYAAGAASRGADMPFIDRMKALFARKGEIDKKITFLSERRAALSQQLDRGYEDMGTLETKEADLRKQFKDASGDLPRRRITSQLLQLRKDLQRRQQLLSVLSQQINVVSTHLHNLELQRQGHAAKLPDSEEMAADAAAAEDVLAELQAGSELAESVSTATHGSISAEEQALYDELLSESKAPPAPQAPPPAKAAAPSQPAEPPPTPQRQHKEAEPG